MTDAREGTVTIKFGEGFAAPWLVVYGAPSTLFTQIREALGYDAEEVADLSLAELIVKASGDAQGIYAAADGLKARPVGKSPRRGSGGAQKATSGQPEASEGGSSENSNEVLLQEIAAATSEQDLTEIYARNTNAFEDQSVVAAFQEKHAQVA